MNNGMIEISVKKVMLVALIYLLLPILLFFFGWLKIYFAIPASVLLILSAFKFYKNQQSEHNSKIRIKLRWLVIASVVLLAFIWIGDVGRMSVANRDSPWRDAIFNDLINYTWPVKYPKTEYHLVYYFTFWLVPAFLGKVFGMAVANMALLLWGFIGIGLTFLLINYYLGTEKKQIIVCVLLLLIFFCGIKYFGMIYSEVMNLPNSHFDNLHTNSDWLSGLYNGHSFNWYLRYNFDEVCQIHNQIFVVWLCTILILLNLNKIENYAFLGMICFAYSPVAFLGMFILLVMLFFVNGGIKFLDLKRKFVSAFSIQNLLSIISIMIPYGMFYTVNSNAGKIVPLPIEMFDVKMIISLLVFYLVEFGLYAILIYKENKNNKLYYIVLAILILSAFFEFQFGNSTARDITMNTTLSATFILMIMILQYMRDNIIGKVITTRSIAIVCLLTIAALTPLGNILFRFGKIVENKGPVRDSWIETYADKVINYENDDTLYSHLLANTEMSMFDIIERNKTESEKKKDENFFCNYQNNRNEIIEGYYYIQVNNRNQYLSISEDGVKISYKPYKIRVLIVNGKTVFEAEESHLAIDIPNGIVDENGYVGTYIRNNSSAQQYGVMGYSDGYVITYGDYYFCLDDEDNIYLKKSSGEYDDSGVWRLERLSEDDI